MMDTYLEIAVVAAQWAGSMVFMNLERVAVGIEAPLEIFDVLVAGGELEDVVSIFSPSAVSSWMGSKHLLCA